MATTETKNSVRVLYAGTSERPHVTLKVCLVGVTHPCHNPRLLREADSLAEAGHDVRVVAPAGVAELSEKDARLLQRRSWRLQVIDHSPVGLSGHFRSLMTRGWRRVSAELFKLTNSPAFAERAGLPVLSKMTALASRERADWFIAHAHGALPVAAAAAHRWESRLGFDCEDLLGHGESESAKIARLVESRYLSSCRYISVPSQGMAMELARLYGKLPLTVLYNVFPTKLGKGMLAPGLRSWKKAIKLYWFSQTIGEGRGLEDALRAVAILGEGVELHLRGRWANGYEEKLRHLANVLGVKLHIHPVIDHDQLIQQMEEFDIGLALEPPTNHNAALTQSNKIGSYFLAGMAIAATDTPGQREVLGDDPQAGFLYPSGQPEMLAAGLKRWLNDRQALSEAQKASWEIGRNRFCWDLEQPKFFAALGIASPVAY